MSIKLQNTSEKLNIVDRTTFENYQQSQSSSNGMEHGASEKYIRNSKYKKTRTTYNLLHFLTIKPKRTAAQRRRAAASARKNNSIAAAATRNVPKKRRGKQREGGHKKHISRLKKSILRYRQQKRQDGQQVENIAEQLETVKIESKPSEEILNAVKAEVHSRRFREYCDNCTTLRLCELSEQLLRELHRFQNRAFAVNEIKARAHRRFVLGFREVQNFMLIDKIKLIFIAGDCEDCSGEAGLNETIAKLKSHCQDKGIPYIFSLRRRQIAYALFKKVPVSCVGILDYDGMRDVFAQLLDELQTARDAYQQLLRTKQATILQIQNDAAIETLTVALLKVQMV